VNVPNLLSLARLPLAAAFLLLPGTPERALIIALAAASDYLDGWWARTRGPATRTGALLDPITDKVFIVTALVAFVVEGTLSHAGLLLLVVRDIIVGIGALAVAVLKLPVTLQARFPGKLVTTLQIVAVLVLVAWPRAAPAVIATVAAATIWAIADYARNGVRALRAPPRAR
jgi:cardiolipin synthase